MENSKHSNSQYHQDTLESNKQVLPECHRTKKSLIQLSNAKATPPEDENSGKSHGEEEANEPLRASDGYQMRFL